MDWPKRGEQLFVSGKDWHLNACIDCYHMDLCQLADGYKESANALADSIADGKATLDTAIYPVVFLYRQYLELMIKGLISLLRQLEGNSGEYPFHHKLSELWNEAKARLKSHYGDGAPQAIDNMDSCIEDFRKYDPDSFAFRYPTAKNGKRNLTGLLHINLRNLYETMERISSMLDTFATDLSTKLDGLREMLQSYR